MLTICIGPFVLLLTVPMNIWLTLLLVVLMGVGVAGIGMCVMHDAMHGSYSEKKWVNTLLGGTLYLLGGHVLNWYIGGLNFQIEHHLFPNVCHVHGGGQSGLAVGYYLRRAGLIGEVRATAPVEV